MTFTGGSDGKESASNSGDLDSILGWGRSPGEGNGNPLQYSCLRNPMDRGAWRTTFWGGFPLCAYCARTQSSLRAQGGALESSLLPLYSGSCFLLFFLGAAAQDQIRFCTCKPCFRNRLWGASLVGKRVFPCST